VRHKEKEFKAVKSRLSRQSFTYVLAAGALALTLVAGLFLLSSRLHVRAKSASESTGTDTPVAQTVLTPTSQTRSPAKGALITGEGRLPIEGVAWKGDSRPPFPGDPTLLPIENDGEPNYVVEWTEPISGDFYVLYEAEDPYFTDQVQRNIGSEDKNQKFISGQPDGTYYYRVKAYNVDGQSRWSNVESATVGTSMASAASAPLSLAAGEQITVWVRIDSGAWHTATLTETDWGGWEWSYDWPLPEQERYTEHAIHTRASVDGTFGSTDTITVTVNNRVYYAYFPVIFRRWPPVPLAPEVEAINNPQHRPTYSISWSYGGREGIPDPYSFTVQEDTNPDFSTPINYDAGSSTSLQLTKNQEGTFYYRVRGNNSYGHGEYSDVVSTDVRLRPYAPTLHAIDNADGDNSYVVEWSYEYIYPTVDTFVLQEATNSQFSGAVNYPIDGAVTSRAFTDKDNETYYYRVKGRNEEGDGPWSATRSVTSVFVTADFYDDFSDPDSGWMTHDARCCLGGCDRGDLQQHPEYKYSLWYEDGRYHVHIPLDCRGGGNHGDTRHIYPVTYAPDVERPATRTCIELKGGFEHWDPTWSFWGLVFAADDDKDTIYSLEVNNLGDWAVLKRTGYDFPGPNAPWQNETRREIVDEGWTGGKKYPAHPAFEGNTLRAEVEGNKVKLFINGLEVGQYSNTEIGSFTKVGIIGGDWEITPTQIGYSYFYVDEGCDDY